MAITNTLNLPQPFVDAATSDHKYTEGRYSVTDVLGGTCEAILKRRHAGEVTEDVADRVWAIFGTAVHKVLQDAKATDSQLQENWLSADAPVDGYALSGIFDLYDDATGTVTDYKTTSVWTAIFGDYEKWRRQCLLYCWLLQRHGFNAWRGEVVALLRDHNRRKAETEEGYPKHPVVKVEWEFTPSDMEWAEEYLIEWFLEVQHEETVPDEALEPCSEEQRWHKPDTWAVVKDGRKRASRVLESEEEAVEWLNDATDGTQKGYHIEFRCGEDTRCDGYCSVAEFCPYRSSLVDADKKK